MGEQGGAQQNSDYSICRITLQNQLPLGRCTTAHKKVYMFRIGLGKDDDLLESLSSEETSSFLTAFLLPLNK